MYLLTIYDIYNHDLEGPFINIVPINNTVQRKRQHLCSNGAFDLCVCVLSSQMTFCSHANNDCCKSDAVSPTHPQGPIRVNGWVYKVCDVDARTREVSVIENEPNST